MKMSKTYSGELSGDTNSESNVWQGSVSENGKSNISKIVYSNILLKHVCIDF